MFTLNSIATLQNMRVQTVYINKIKRVLLLEKNSIFHKFKLNSKFHILFSLFVCFVFVQKYHLYLLSSGLWFGH